MDLGYYEMLLPASVPLQLKEMDVVYDSQAQPARYIVSSVEQTALGWRLFLRVAVA